MTPEELAAIRERANVNPIPSGSVTAWICDADRDRRALLDELEALRSELEKSCEYMETANQALEQAAKNMEALRKENERLRTLLDDAEAVMKRQITRRGELESENEQLKHERDCWKAATNIVIRGKP